jgi:hypothetical protein
VELNEFEAKLLLRGLDKASAPAEAEKAAEALIQSLRTRGISGYDVLAEFSAPEEAAQEAYWDAYQEWLESDGDGPPPSPPRTSPHPPRSNQQPPQQSKGTPSPPAMNKKPLTNRHWFLLTTVTVVLFCLWPNFLTGFFAVSFVVGWLVHDARTFVQTLWRIILGLIILVSGGLTYACLVTEITGDRPTQVTLGSIVFTSAVFGLVRSLIKARTD